MGYTPKPPSGRTAEFDPAKVNDRLAFANLRKAAIVMIAKRSRSGFAVQPGSDDVCDIAAALLGGRGDTRHRLAVGAVTATVSPTAKISGCPGTVKSGWMTIRPFRSAATPSHAAAGEARTPAAQMIVSASTRRPPKTTLPAVTLVTASPSATSTPSCSSALPGVVRKAGVIARQHVRTRLDQQDASNVRVDRPEVGR